jgi:type II secretory pathway predicted ATPase ExeA
MYLTHYNLRIKPFETSPDPRFIWLSEKHKEALASLKYGIQENKGFLLLTGDIGTGKTTLINCLLSANETNAVIASIPDPDLSIDDFFLLLSNEFSINLDFDTKGKFLIQLENFLYNTYSKEKKALLIIDEAHRLNHQLLEQIRLLSNIEKQNLKLINIFFVGQNELHELIMDERNKALRQRIAVHYNIEPLTKPETEEYIKHRLRVAGTEEEIFSCDAIYELSAFSKGYPRLINIICDRALLTSYVLGVKKIDGKIVKKCVDELIIPVERTDIASADFKRSEVDKERERDRSTYRQPSILLQNQVISRLKHIASLHDDLAINIVCELGDQQRLRVVKDLVSMIEAAEISVKLSTEQTFFLKAPPPVRMSYNPNDEDLFRKVITALESYMGGQATRILKEEMQPGVISLEFYGAPVFLANTRVGFR